MITSEENGRSSVGREEGSAFLQMDQEAPPAPASPQPQEDDMEDLVSSQQRREEKIIVNPFSEKLCTIFSRDLIDYCIVIVGRNH